jgi:hypothetical protein
MPSPVPKHHVLSATRIVCKIFLFATLCAVVAILAAILASASRVLPSTSPPVSVADVMSKIAGSEAANDQLASLPDSGVHVPNADGYTIPQALDDLLKEDDATQTVLDRWLGSIPLDGRQQFLNELSTVVSAATQHAAAWEWDDRQRYVAAAMNQYAHVKIERVMRAENEIETAAERDAQYRTALGALLGIIVIVTMMLVLLAIERNTRPENAAR